eukprot:7976629-Alexandrium_andersonii.AAC.1
MPGGGVQPPRCATPGGWPARGGAGGHPRLPVQPTQGGARDTIPVDALRAPHRSRTGGRPRGPPPRR